MKQVTIYSDCQFNYTTRQGRYFTVLEYKNTIKRISGEIKGEQETSNRVIIYSLIEALKLLKEPCELTISTCTPVGFKKGRKKPNGDLIGLLLDAMNEKDCVFKEKLLSKDEIYCKTLSHTVKKKV